MTAIVLTFPLIISLWYENRRVRYHRLPYIFNVHIDWAASSEFGTYRLCEQRRFRRACAVSPEPPMLPHTSIESRGTFRQKARSLAPLNGWACAVKICHDGMLENTNSLDGAQLISIKFELFPTSSTNMLDHLRDWHHLKSHSNVKQRNAFVITI